MKKWIIPAALLLIAVAAYSFRDLFMDAGDKPWREDQLMEPSELAEMIKNKSPQTPVIFNIGPAGSIPGSIYIGDGKDKEALQELRKRVEKFPRDTAIVIYCGCCPFGVCPNVRPPFRILNEMKFTKHRLLNLKKNLKTDWINKGYPLE